TIILADEPTGALDRKNSTEIMELLKEISKDRLVLVITHDQKICGFADNIISMRDGKIIGEANENQAYGELTLNKNDTIKVSDFRRGLKNFRVHIMRYVAVALAISIGVIAFILSLSSGNIMGKSISDFKEKNTAFNNGYIKVEETGELLVLLKADERVENVYEQYVIKNVTLTLGEKSETMAEKYPMPKATEVMSYGVMPKLGKNQITLSPSLAKKFDTDLNKLIGKEITLTYGEKDYTLTVSGIFNAGYDDFFVSSDIEQNFYQHTDGQKPYSISYDVKSFEDIVPVNQSFVDKGLEVKTAAKEVGALQSTFTNLSRLFLIVSILILTIGLFISIILLVKLQNSRYKEIGLLSALGFSQKQIRSMIVNENILLSATSAIFNAILIGITYLVSMIFKIDLILTLPQILLSICGTGVVVILISVLASYKLIHTEPAVALRK
ncbi:MAG: FtsX-like permease family protein, partial [Oscillospiraceae bacterium]